ncbi:Squalene monooxygenase [Hibiscus syriacus]|uniref:Squalene monooxygenase n=1 Tax=Hibiscus syriacus TaxID=106335 RepID=A0A6A2WXD9_HIBSY|nr:Squalene monooxygenase [Hibiscus syriacus]
MADHYVVGVAGAIASLLGFFFLYNKLKRTTSMEFPNENYVKKTRNCEDSESTDVIIVGAGVAGAALAYSLGKDGRRVRVIERDLNEPRRITGENLMPGGYVKLIELGLEECVDEIDAQQVLGYVLYMDEMDATISFPLENFQSNVSGRSFHNGRTVTSLLEENGTVKGVHYKDKSGQALTAYAPLTVVCDGCFSNLRHSLCNPKIDVPSYCVVFVLHAKIMELFRNLPSISDGEMAHYLKTQVASKVLPELYSAFIAAIDKDMHHSITGGGMIVALSDVVLLRDLLRPLYNLHDAFALCKYLESFYTLRNPMSSTINTLANVLHKVLSASSDPAMQDIQQACFDYLRLGGAFAYGLSALHSGLCPRPLSLAFHFFAISIYGVGRSLLPFPTPKRFWNGAKLL